MSMVLRDLYARCIVERKSLKILENYPSLGLIRVELVGD